MKTTLFIGLLLCLRLVAAAQQWKSPLPLDSVTQKITYQGVTQVSGATQAELYSRAREWFANTFGSSKVVLEMDDREVGKLIGKGYAEFGFAGAMGSPLPWAMWRKIKVELKDGRYRYTITDFLLGGPIATPNLNIRPLEPWLASAVRQGKQPNKMALSVINGAQETGEAEIKSLQAAMSKASSKDW